MKIRFSFVMFLLGATACNSPGSNPSSSFNPTGTSEAISNGGSTSPAVSVNPPTVNTNPTSQNPPIKVSTRNVGLVWSGAGACPEGCALAGYNAVTAAGLTPRYVNESTPTSTDAEIAAIFADARVWVMPGGVSNTEVNAMSSGLKTALINFVQDGGGYVGWCAGAFSATSIIGTTDSKGLGLMPGNTMLYSTRSAQNSYGASIEKMTWFNSTHYFYLEGGPYLTNLPSSVEVVSRYDDQVSVGAARTTYGSGRVFISGVHPEAPSWWWSGTSVSDPDGSDEAYAQDMIKWSAHLE